jgi:uncharacterized protein (DUF1697 family)
MKVVAFLRAINVGGRFVKMADLLDHFRALGHASAWSFIQSGNIVLEADAVPSGQQIQALEDALAERLGFRSEVFLRSEAELAAVVERARLWRQRLGTLLDVGERAEVNVLFVNTPLGESAAAAVAGFDSEIDRFALEGREVYWSCLRSQSESRFSGANFERRFKTRITVRRERMLGELLAAVRSVGVSSST